MKNVYIVCLAKGIEDKVVHEFCTVKNARSKEEAISKVMSTITREGYVVEGVKSFESLAEALKYTTGACKRSTLRRTKFRSKHNKPSAADLGLKRYKQIMKECA